MPDSAAAPALIFDIGNVLLRWDPRLLYRTLLPDDAAIDAFFAEIGFDAWNTGFDRGTAWDHGVAAHSALHPARAELIAAFHHRWHETLPGPVDGAPELMAELAAAGIPLYAITNFSSAKFAETRERFPFLATAFRDVVVSGDEGLLKPDPEIYRRCLARNGLAAAGSIFVDDSPKNVEGARAVGIDAIQFTTIPALRHTLTLRGLLPAGIG
jgi:2-haloacid dehalogenase